MSFESSLRQLLVDAVPELRAAVKDAIVATLVDDQQPIAFELLRKAYELGYREALANQPFGTRQNPRIKADDDDLEPDDTDDGVPSVPPDPEDVEVEGEDGSSRGSHEKDREVDWDALGASEPVTPEAAPAAIRRDAAPLRVRSSLTIGSLRTRIFKTFHLERFDIDVVICRRGDKSRRQLKSTVRLAKYELEDDGRKAW